MSEAELLWNPEILGKVNLKHSRFNVSAQRNNLLPHKRLSPPFLKPLENKRTAQEAQESVSRAVFLLWIKAKKGCIKTDMRYTEKDSAGSLWGDWCASKISMISAPHYAQECGALKCGDDNMDKCMVYAES